MNRNSLKRWLSIVAILWLAAGLRFYRLGVQSFWNDEGNSARLSERPIALILEGTAADIHPPLYYLALHGWRNLVGDSEFGLRSLSAFAGIGLVAVSYGLGRAVTGRSQATFATLLVALNPALVYYSQETRMYELLAFWVALSGWLLLKWLSRPERSLALAYLLTVTAGLYTHYFFPAGLLAHGLWVGLRQPRMVGRWLGLVSGAGLLYLPWLPIFIRQAGGRPADSTVWLTFLGDSGRFLLFGPAGADSWVMFLVGGLALWALARIWREKLWLVPAGALLPIGLAVAAGTTREAYFKFLLMSVPFWALWLALPVTKQKGLYGLVGIILLVVSGRALVNLYFDPAYARADYRAIAARIAADNQPMAGIILDAPNQWEVFTYYHRQGATVYPIPRGYPDPAGIDQELSEIANRHKRLYAIFWGEAERDPQRLVESWLDSHAFKTTDEWVGDVRFVVYAVPESGENRLETRLDLAFGEQIELVGYTLNQEVIPAGEILQLTLFWQSNSPIETRYKLFLHLVGEDGRPIAQRDSEPMGNLAPTTSWSPGQIVVDNHGLLIPVGLAPGRYTLLLGLYDFSDPTARLWIDDPAGAITAWPLSTIEVTP